MVAEPLHALTYFAPESHRAFEDVGLRGFWRGYFAGRAAPLGAAPVALVTATFFGFHPDFVARAIPSIWSLVEPSDAIEARLDGIDRVMRGSFESELPTIEAAKAAAAIRRAVDLAPVAGHPLFGASCELGWSEPDWVAATERLRERGWLDGGRTTPEGSRVRAGVERDTDRSSAALVDHIDDLDLVTSVLGPIAERLQESGAIPYPNPIGVPLISIRNDDD